MPAHNRDYQALHYVYYMPDTSSANLFYNFLNEYKSFVTRFFGLRALHIKHNNYDKDVQFSTL